MERRLACMENRFGREAWGARRSVGGSVGECGGQEQEEGQRPRGTRGSGLARPVRTELVLIFRRAARMRSASEAADLTARRLPGSRYTVILKCYV